MAKNGTINKTTFTDQTKIQNNTSISVKALHVSELRTAIGRLEGYSVNVDNCGCQSCQNTCTCQSDKCQSCQGCQSCQNTCTCQSCQRGNCNCNCSNCSDCSNCDCGDDYNGGY